MFLPKNVKLILDTLTANGIDAYVVGGSVRDYIIGREIGDFDICSSATPEEIMQIFSSFYVIPTGLKHGTVTVNIDNENYEITTFRTDGEYGDNRHPESVQFVKSINEDLKRRDFTMNAVAYNGEFVDPFGGINDIKQKVIKCVGNPDIRFSEDALRIMRAIRFASVLGFSIEENTKKSVLRNKELLKNVSAERLFAELSKLIMGDNCFDVLNEYRDVIAVIIPEIAPTFDFEQNNPWHIYDVWQHITKSVSVAPKDLTIRLAMLFHDLGKPDCKTVDEKGIDHFYKHPYYSEIYAKKILKQFKVSNEIFKSVTELIKYHDGFIRTEEKSIKKWLAKIGVEQTKNLIEVKKADMLAQNLEKTKEEVLEIENTKLLLEDIINRNEPYKISDLDINGFDLMNLGYRGSEIGEKLNFLLEQVIDEKVENKKDCLVSALKKDK